MRYLLAVLLAFSIDCFAAEQIPLVIVNGTVKQLSVNDSVSQSAGILNGTSSAIGGSQLNIGQCASTTVTVTGADSTSAVNITPITYPGDGFYWKGYVSSSNTVTVKICAVLKATPVSSAYNVRVIK